MRKIKEGEMIWSAYFSSWIKVIEILEDGYFFFMIAGRIEKSQSPISVFEEREVVIK